MRAFTLGFAVGAFWHVWRRQREHERHVSRYVHELDQALVRFAEAQEKWRDDLVRAVTPPRRVQRPTSSTRPRT